MPINDKGYYSAAGLARKAGKLISGTYACTDAAKRNRVKLIIVTEDTADNTFKKLSSVCENNKIKIVKYGESKILGKALCRNTIKIIGIIDSELAKLILSKMQIERR